MNSMTKRIPVCKNTTGNCEQDAEEESSASEGERETVGNLLEKKQQGNLLERKQQGNLPTNTFHILHKCIHTHIYEEFIIRSHIQAYNGDANVYGLLWTPTCICTVWTFFPYYFLSFLFLLLPKKTLSSPTPSTIA